MTALVGHVADALQECTLPGEAEMPQVAESPLPQGPAEEPATQAAAQPEPAPQPKIYASPQEISMIEHVVEREVHGALYFYAPQYTNQKTASWFENKLQYCFEMEGHRFFC